MESEITHIRLTVLVLTADLTLSVFYLLLLATAMIIPESNRATMNSSINRLICGASKIEAYAVTLNGGEFTPIGGVRVKKFSFSEKNPAQKTIPATPSK